MVDLSVSIINYKTKELTAKCLESILEKKWQISYQIFLVDNDSEDGSVEYFKKHFPKVKLIASDKNLGFAGGHNLAIKKAKSRYILILNSDTQVMDRSLDNLVEFMDREGLAIGSCQLVNRDGSFQPSGGDLPFFWPIFNWIAGLDDILPIKEKLPSLHRKFKSYFNGERQVGWVGGTAMIISTPTIDKIGFLDDHIFMYAEDVEYCLRASRRGLKIGWTNQAKIIHLGGGSLDQPAFRQWLGEYRGLVYIYQKYFGAISATSLRFLIYLFTILRMLAFLVVGKPKISQTYAKVLISL